MYLVIHLRLREVLRSFHIALCVPRELKTARKTILLEGWLEHRTKSWLHMLH